MVDAKDLKSFGRITHTGSSPVPGTKKMFIGCDVNHIFSFISDGEANL